MNEVKPTVKQAISDKWLFTGLGSFLVFVLVTGLVFANITQSFDASLALSVNGFGLGSALTSFMVLATEYGREYFWIPIVALMLLLGKRDTKILAIELASLFVVGIVAGEAMKFAAFRARPFETLSGIITRVPTDTDSSYPSGHALIVSIGAIFALARFRRKSIAIILCLEAAIVCYSRVYVGMHYPMDIIGGIFLGGAIVFLGMFALEKYMKKIVDAVANVAQKMLGKGIASV